MYYKAPDGTRSFYQYTRGSVKGANTKLPCLVFLHGWVANWTIWKKSVLFFQKKGYPVLVLDWRGHGKSDRPKEKEKYAFHLFINDLYAIIRKERIKEHVLIGHSMGGMIALAYAYHHHPSALVLCSTTHKIRKQWRLSPYLLSGLETLVMRVPKKRRADFDLSSFSFTNYDLLMKAYKATDARSMLYCFSSLLHEQPSFPLKSITVPTLIVHGSKDKLISPKLAQELHEGLVHSHFIDVPMGHQTFTYEHLNDIIDMFLQSHFPKTTTGKPYDAPRGRAAGSRKK